ncbi:sensor histidine kinase KdpD [Bacteroides sp. 51]|uniref:sensor histidine kinase n=1 Tax=Bacteroides sp. 51 TaxID=2302938 RepID=UPI0013D3916C|nr:HAMP domain-containing sensor histidine kinase [Bacteroides sp. 51]NDV82090.1 sensor histidine kinase [Bacteroides sp. 51]
MKEVDIKLFTVVGLITVVLLQSSWLYSTYSLIKISIEEKSNSLILDATERELFSRLVLVADSMPDGTLFTVNEVPTTGEYASKAEYLRDFQEALLKYDSRLSLITFDSIYSSLLSEEGINVKCVINIVNSNDSILESSQDGSFPWFGTIESKKLPIRADDSQLIQAVIVNPYWTIFRQMGILLLATVIMVVFVVACITSQIRIIMKQNRIAQIREDFSHAMIHDMKTPITSILMSSRMLHSKRLNDYPEKEERHFNIIETEGERLLTLTEKVLTVAKLEQDKLELHKQIIPLRPIIEDLINKFEAKRSKDIIFVTQFETETIYAEYIYIKEAISNLIDNAIKYSHESVEIRISCTEKDKQTIIKVRDNGLGIDIKDQTKIFEKFERASALRRSSKGGATGFGLGLNYVQRVVEAHGGSVSLTSIEEQFSEFTIKIPILIEDV